LVQSTIRLEEKKGLKFGKGLSIKMKYIITKNKLDLGEPGPLETPPGSIPAHIKRIKNITLERPFS